jgi:hypothetical protein
MVVLRSICKQRERARTEVEVGGGGDGAYNEGRAIIEKPRLLDMSFADTHRTSTLTLGQFSTMCGDTRLR